MADLDNHSSMLPQPTRSANVLRALSEMSSSDHNTRNTMLPPIGHKRNGSNLPEPAPKRKTLVERAGEPIRLTATVPIEPMQAPAGSFTNYRSASTYTNTSAKSVSNISRNTSNSSFSASVGSGLRPPSGSLSNLARPKTALAKDRALKMAEARPYTSLGQQPLGLDPGKHKRMAPYSFPMTGPRGRTPSRELPLNPVKKAASFACLGRPGVIALPASRRELSIASRLQDLSLDTVVPKPNRGRTPSPSKLPQPVTPAPQFPLNPVQPPKFRSKSPTKPFLTRWSNIEALDADEHYTNFKRMFEDYQTLYKQTLGEVHEAKNANNLYTATIEKLENDRSSQVDTIISLKSECETLRYRLEAAEKAFAEQKEYFQTQIEELRSTHRAELEAQKLELRKEHEQLKAEHRREVDDLKKSHDVTVREERSQRTEAISQASAVGALEKQRHLLDMDMKDQEIRTARAEAAQIQEALERERTTSNDVRKLLSDAGSLRISMESIQQALQAKIEYLESDSKSQSNAYAEMERKMNEAYAEADKSGEKLRKEETLRRKLHNQVQELKGNIRVFCRVRPTLPNVESEELTVMKFPNPEDLNEIEVKGQEEKSSLGKSITKTYPFCFDRVFDPTSSNGEVFEEISQLIQSALDGFNVCIFAYGQTGSGKTYTMSSEDGMIPKALRQIYTTSEELRERGWKYTMEGSFIEVYNEEIRDLLGKDQENKKHEIRHDMVACETTITDTVTISLDSQDQVEEILQRAMAKRSVAATNANEHSSRSHSVFILRLTGHNSITGEKSKGVLNLVDLAGSERLAHSKVEGQRLKETQSINKSLSCLGDVIGALGQQGSTVSAFDPRASTTTATTSSSSSSLAASHIPYRNSKLTYLLQFSLGGNSKTLMFVMVAPEKKCLGETLTSLKFADKVSRTRVGVAKKVR